jgi:membrane-associated phospholipid phosphatase
VRVPSAGAAGAFTADDAGDHRPSPLHRSPPITLRQVREWRPWVLPGAVALVVLLAIAAAIDGARLLAWDAPITDAFVALRSPGVNRAALWISRMGSTPVVIAAGLAGVGLAARRCPAVAMVMLITIASRPPVEWLLKEIVARPRPSGARLVVGTGFAFPSGHVLAAAATWGFVPVIAGLYLRRRWIWWAVTAVAWTMIGAIAWSRVWLGVHWTSDVVAGLAIAFIALSVAETTLARRHDPAGPCTHPRHFRDRRRLHR